LFGRRALIVAGLGLATTLIAAAGAVCLTSGCSTLGYYAQAVGGHLEIVNKAQPVARLLDDPALPERTRARLVLSQQMRNFAVHELKLPDNRSYRSYAALGRASVVWNVVAAPELSLQLKTWCFPVVGCVGYRGYYDEAAARTLAEQLKAEGHEINVYGVPAYSTLGKTEWLGGDPLLDTFVFWPELELARLIFHELAHQVVYADDDTEFNESFATAVERIGGRLWLAARPAGSADPQAAARVAATEARRADFRRLTFATRDALRAIYAGAGSDGGKRAAKAAALAEMRARYVALKADAATGGGPWAGFSGYDPWFERANNASIAVLAAYNDLVPAFEALWEREGRDFGRFYAAVQGLAALPKAERRARLANIAPPKS
jgi:predicted aminopeptidase